MSLVKKMEKKSNCQECIKSKHRTEEEKKYLNKRLKTIEGQVRGIMNMIDEDRYCNDILIQIEDIKNNKIEVIDELIELIKKLD